MAQHKKKRKAKSKAGRASNHRPRSSNPKRKGHKRRTSKNPFTFFGGSARPKTVGKAVIGVLAGVSIGRAVTNMLPASFTATNLTHSLSAAAVALAEWWALSLIDPEFGTAAGLGGLAYAGNVALNAFLPEVGGYTGISGVRRGTGDFINARLQATPLLPGASGISGVGRVNAYPSAYGRIAA